MNASRAELVLDTHIWLWSVGDSERLAPEARPAIEQAADQGLITIPAISVWEIAMLAARSRIELAAPIRKWIADALSAPGVGLAPLSPEIAVEAYDLPGRFHGDPADRMIVATARMRDATLVTRDRRILAYGEQGHVKVLPG